MGARKARGMPQAATNSRRLRSPDVVAAIALLVLAGLVVVLGGRPLATDDTWWHLKLGALYAAQGPWPTADPMLHTADTLTVPHEWLFQVVLYAIRRAAGFTGLRVFHAAVVSATLLLAYRTFRRQSRSAAVAACATAVFIALSWYRLFQLRPDIITVPATLLLTGLLFARERPATWRTAALAAALFAIWANVHSIFAAGLALVAAALFGLALQGLLARSVRQPEGDALPGPGARGIAVALVVGLVASLLNPQGIEQHLTFFTESGTGQIWKIRDDFLPFDPFSPPVGNRALTPFAWALVDALLVAFAGAAALAAIRFARRRTAAALDALDPMFLALGVAAVVAMLTAVRFHWMAIFPLLYLLRADRRRAAPARAGPAPAAWIAAAATVAIAVAFPWVNDARAYEAEVQREPRGYASPWLDARYCGTGVRFLSESGVSGRMFNSFNMGGFLGYWLAPTLRTFVDGRMDHFSAKVLRDYLAIRRASRLGPAHELNRLLSDYGIDVYFGDSFPDEEYKGRFSITYLRRIPDWIPVYASSRCSIYLRRGPRSRQNLDRIAAYYDARGVPFDRNSGLDVSAAVRAAPEWAAAQDLTPPDREALERARHSEDPDERYDALVRLAEFYWRTGNFEDELALDYQALALRPHAKAPRRRMADALLQLGHVDLALRVARQLFEEDPTYEDVGYLYSVAQSLSRRRAERLSKMAEDQRAAPDDQETDDSSGR